MIQETEGFDAAEGAIAHVGGPAAWRGPALDWKSEGLYALGKVHLQEIAEALDHLKSLGNVDLPEISQASFPLEATRGLLARVRGSIQAGRGFAMLRGLPREIYSADDMARIYFGIGAYLGRPLIQSYMGEMLGHVMDHAGLEDAPRAYHAGGHLGMHTDSCDIVGLMCLRTAQSGGASRIASATAVHDALVDSRPDLVETLYRGFYYRRMELDAQYGSGQVVSRQRVPVFTRGSDADAPLACYFLGGYARRAAARGDVPLTPLELEAIEAVEALAESPAFYLDMNFAEGDIQFLNNRLVLHGRTDYVDAEPIDQRRHLLRLWLQVPGWPPLPEEQVFHTPADHARWALRRTPQMELPSVYIQDARSRLVQRSAAAGPT